MKIKTYKIKSVINEIVKVKNKSEKRKSTIKNFETLYESQEKLLKFFNNYSKIVSQTKFKTKCGEGLKILTPNQILQKLPIDIPRLKAGNTSENLLNEIRQTIHSLYQAKEITKQAYNNIMNLIQGIIQK